jgi:hypothetical protein
VLGEEGGAVDVDVDVEVEVKVEAEVSMSARRIIPVEAARKTVILEVIIVVEILGLIDGSGESRKVRVTGPRQLMNVLVRYLCREEESKLCGLASTSSASLEGRHSVKVFVAVCPKSSTKVRHGCAQSAISVM